MFDEDADPVESAPMDEIMEVADADSSNDSPEVSNDDLPETEAPSGKTMVPLSALQKLRDKKRELELELQWERQRNAQASQAMAAPPKEDNSRYESATKEDLGKMQYEAVRMVEERQWIKNNPEKFERVNGQLPEFLKQRPNLTSAINSSLNRYEEAYTLMEALTPKQQQQLRAAAAPQAKKASAPNSPGSVPKAAGINEAVDVMNMTDAEFVAWRQAKRRRR